MRQTVILGLALCLFLAHLADARPRNREHVGKGLGRVRETGTQFHSRSETRTMDAQEFLAKMRSERLAEMETMEQFQRELRDGLHLRDEAAESSGEAEESSGEAEESSGEAEPVPEGTEE